VVELSGSTVTLRVKGGELGLSRLRLPGRSGAATVQGRNVERNGDLMVLGKRHTLKAGDRLVVEVQAYGEA
jgi:hypothetical protein